MKKLLYVIPSIIYIAVFGQSMFRRIVKIENLKKEKEVLLKEKEQIKNEIYDYNILLLKLSDPFYREKIARDRIQMVLPGEKIYRLIEEK